MLSLGELEGRGGCEAYVRPASLLESNLIDGTTRALSDEELFICGCPYHATGSIALAALELPCETFMTKLQLQNELIRTCSA